MLCAKGLIKLATSYHHHAPDVSVAADRNRRIRGLVRNRENRKGMGTDLHIRRRMMLKQNKMFVIILL